MHERRIDEATLRGDCAKIEDPLLNSRGGALAVRKGDARGRSDRDAMHTSARVTSRRCAALHYTFLSRVQNEVASTQEEEKGVSAATW